MLCPCSSYSNLVTQRLGNVGSTARSQPACQGKVMGLLMRDKKIYGIFAYKDRQIKPWCFVLQGQSVLRNVWVIFSGLFGISLNKKLLAILKLSKTIFHNVNANFQTFFQNIGLSHINGCRMARGKNHASIISVHEESKKLQKRCSDL